MRRILICTGVLGGGTAITFAAAALVATMFPTGNLVYGGQPDIFLAKPMERGIAVPMPAPAIDPVPPDVIVDDAEPGTIGG